MDSDAPQGLDPAIRSYYDRSPEEARLGTGVSQLEALRTREILTRFLPRPPGVVLDVGGGAGAYSFWLSAQGFTVHFVDAVPRLVDLARREAKRAEVDLASITVGDARDLGFDDSTVDCVLLLGPLYHLPSEPDRRKSLMEATRVLRPGGLLVAACITRWASILDGLVHDYLSDPRFVSIVEADLASGQHRNPTQNLGYFTTAFFHTPDGFETELRSTGMELLGLFGLEGPAGLLRDFEDRWEDARRRADLIRVARELESVPSLLGLSPHLLGIVRKKERLP